MGKRRGAGSSAVPSGRWRCRIFTGVETPVYFRIVPAGTGRSCAAAARATRTSCPGGFLFQEKLGTANQREGTRIRSGVLAGSFGIRSFAVKQRGAKGTHSWPLFGALPFGRGLF